MLISLEMAVGILRGGGVVAIPTDTVYGLASLPENEGQLFELKGRPEGQKILWLHADVESMGSEFEPFAPFWPGPLSVVVGERGHRVPDHEVARALIRKTGPLAVTSANRSGEPSATTAAEVEAIFGDDLPLLEGECKLGEASTIIALRDGEWELLRAGPVPFPLPRGPQSR